MLASVPTPSAAPNRADREHLCNCHELPDSQEATLDMNRPAQHIEMAGFLASLRDRTASGQTTIALEHGQLPVLVRLHDSSNLVFTFSGAVDRAAATLPRFAATSLHRHVTASVIGLADPSLAQSEDLQLAWYAGHMGFPTQTRLPDLLRQMIDALGATRVVFVGSSGGGFAALYYSWQIPGSVAVVSNPQTNLNHYLRGHVKKYRAACWPALPTDAPLSAAIDDDLAPLYATRSENTIIYLQVASDFFHLRRHFAPFVAALPREFATRLIVRMSDWGQRGHHPVPSHIWIPWMNAALTATETTALSIEEVWAEANQELLPPLEPRTSPSTPDEQIAARLARHATHMVLGSPSSRRSAP